MHSAPRRRATHGARVDRISHGTVIAAITNCEDDVVERATGVVHARPGHRPSNSILALPLVGLARVHQQCHMHYKYCRDVQQLQ